VQVDDVAIDDEAEIARRLEEQLSASGDLDAVLLEVLKE